MTDEEWQQWVHARVGLLDGRGAIEETDEGEAIAATTLLLL